MRLKSVGMGYFLAVPDVISILNLVFGFLAILMVVANLLTDLAYKLVDPRITLE